MRNVLRFHLFCIAAFAAFQVDAQDKVPTEFDLRVATEAQQFIGTYCFDCHDESSKEGGLDLSHLLNKEHFDGTLLFENLITARMPPQDVEQPTAEERRLILNWLSKRPEKNSLKSYRRISRHEFVHSVNDLLGTKLDVVGAIPEDRGTNAFDSDRRIMLSKEQLSAYFSAADEMLDFAFPETGFPIEQIWTTNTIKDSHDTYNIYVRDYEEGLLFSWTRANNGNSYSYFYDNFEPPVKGWYELSFDTAKLGEFEEDVSILVYAGKYYYADDRPQPQRLLGVLSVGSKDVKTHTIQGFLYPGENVSVHCYSRHTWRQQGGQEGAYVKQLKVRGPLLEQWPPPSYRKVFADLPLDAPDRITQKTDGLITTMQQIGSRISVASSSPDELKRVIRRFADVAFSSILTEDELDPYYQVSLDALGKHGDFARAARQGFKAVICSHRFLLAPGVHRNDSFRTAANLARCLWLSVPDQRLLDLANADQLSAERMPAEIDRMLKDPRAERMIRSFCNQWLNLRSFNKVSPSLKLYPEYNDLLNHYLPQETEAYLNHLIQENLPVCHLIDSDFSILNQRLAEHYNIQGVIGQQMRKVSLQPNTLRGGLLTMGSVLKVTSDGFQTSPILRGAWVSRNIAGNTLSPPPENVKPIEPSANKATTLKEQIEEHKHNDSCFACHKSIDPYGFALESFDATGQWRTKYRVETPHQGTFSYRLEGYFDLAGDVDASGQIGEAEFADVIGLKKILISDHKKIAYNFAKKFFEYANGYEPTLKQRIELFDMIPDKAEDCRIKDLITQVITYSFDGGQP